MFRTLCCGLVSLFIVMNTQACAAQPAADLVYHGGTIHTMLDESPSVNAVAVRDGLILATGDLDQLQSMIGEQTQLIDLGGRTMLPGFVDSHGHAYMIGLQATTANLLPPPDGDGRNIESVVRLLQNWADENERFTDRIGWIVGFGYDESQLAERQPPTRHDLDRVSTEVPILIIHQSGHIGVANSKALEVAGVSESTPDPVGGVFRREPGTQVPNGVCEEYAFFQLIFELSKNFDEDVNHLFVEEGARLLASYGYTTGQEGRAVESTLSSIRDVGRAGELDIDLVVYLDVLEIDEVNTSAEYEDRVRVGGVKLTIDGSPQGKTAWLSRPYHIPPEGQSGDYRGYASITQEQAFEGVNRAFKNNWQILCHANGDAAIDQFIAAVHESRNAYPDVENRPVLIHGQTLRHDQVAMLDELGIFPSLFPMHTYYWGDWHRESVLGPERAEHISPTGWVLDRGMMFGTHHDAPVALPDSMRVLSSTVTRRSRSGDILGPQHRVPVWTALKAMTIWPAWQHFEEDRKGTIEKGKLADFVILSDDPMRVDPLMLEHLVVLETIKEGRTIYHRDERSALRTSPAMFGISGRTHHHEHLPACISPVCGDGCFNPALSVLLRAYE